MEEALKAIEYPGVQSVQIIFNMFRLRPAELFLQRGQAAQGRHPGARAAGERPADRPHDAATPRSPQDDHRNFNRHGEMFDVGETFSGVDLRDRAQCRRGVAGAGSARRDDDAVRAALDPDVRCRHLRHPRRQAPRAGRGELSRRRTFHRSATPRWPRCARSTTASSARKCISGGEGAARLSIFHPASAPRRRRDERRWRLLGRFQDQFPYARMLCIRHDRSSARSRPGIRAKLRLCAN